MHLIVEQCFSSIGLEIHWLYKRRQREDLHRCIPPAHTKSRSITWGSSLTVSCAVFATRSEDSDLYVGT